MSNELATQSDAQIIESLVIGGDLSRLTPGQRVTYYRQVCQSLNLNPFTKPFDYITLNGKLTLYARKDATDQVRKNNGVSITKLERERIEDAYVVTAYAQDKTGRTDSSIGVVSIKGLAGDNLANALMKAETKAKRRVTLSICGLGLIDESEVETTPAVRVVVTETGEIIPPASTPEIPDNSHDPTAPKMSIETAESEFSKTANALYGTLPTDTLANYHRGLMNSKKALTEEQQRKRDAIQVIMAARANGRPVQVAPEPEPTETDEGHIF